VLTAIARELAGFIWDIARKMPIRPDQPLSSFCLCSMLEMAAKDQGTLDTRWEKYPFLERGKPASNMVRR
jgi:hypothetical protein